MVAAYAAATGLPPNVIQATARKSLPRGRNALAPDLVAADQSDRLIVAMRELVTQRGYSDVRVADVVARAGVAKVRFYELFDSKVGCFLALIDQIFSDVTSATVAALDPDGTVPERIEQGIRAIVRWVHSHEEHARVMFIEGPSAGREAIERLAEGRELLARFYIGLREELRALDPKVPEVSTARAHAIVGAISEAIVVDLRHGEGSGLSEAHLVDELVEIVTLLATG